MTDEQALGVDAEEIAPAAPPPPLLQIIVLTAYAEVFGETKPLGKVLQLPQAEAQRLIGAGVARIATEFDRKIGGFAE